MSKDGWAKKLVPFVVMVARLILVALALFLLSACGSEAQTPAALTPTVSSTATATATPSPMATPFDPSALRVEVVAENLQVPWAIDFASDGRIFFTERPGRVRVIQDGRLLPEPWATLPVAAVGEGGLLGLALDPQFERNRYVYVYYTYRYDQGQLRNRVVRLTDRDGRGQDPETIIDGIAGANIHDGGRIKFGPDGKLYITTGDASQSQLAQDMNSLAGKILRLNADGSIPSDNPFPGSPVYSLGHRNPQGLAWHPVTGQLFATEHGPTGNDEVNIIQPGGNYGWPVVQARAGRSQFIDPILVFSPSVAPTGATFFQDEFFFTTLRGEHLHRVTLQPPDFRQVQRDQRLLEGEYGRLRDAVVGPDGALYITTSNRDGRGSPDLADDRILRFALAGR